MNEAKYAEEVGLRVCDQAEERKEKEKNMPRRILHRAKKYTVSHVIYPTLIPNKMVLINN